MRLLQIPRFALSGYSAAWQAAHDETALASARVVLPWLSGRSRVESVLDVGCGRGAWLRAAAELGVPRLLGIDGPGSGLEAVLPAGVRHQVADLCEPLHLGMRFDLALCLEVAEHLPPRAGPVLVASLVRHSPLVLFSAAIPGQGGDGHRNEAWPDEWSRVFADHGYRALDVVRPALWGDSRIAWWYRQNAVLYFAPDYDPGPFRQGTAPCGDARSPARLVHPELFDELVHRERRSLSGRFWSAYTAFWTGLARRLRRPTG